MDRRAFLGLLGGASAVATAGCSAPGGAQTLSNPTIGEESSRRKHLSFTAAGEEVAAFGADGTVSDGVIDLSTSLWHRTGTTVESIRLQVWMPPADVAAEVAVVSPVSGDSSPPPEVTLSVPDRGRGQVIEITDLDDLADETISTLDLLVRPGEGSAGRLFLDATIELASTDWFGGDYTLDGRLELTFPAVGNR